MNKLIAFALLGLGLTQALYACSSDSGSDGTGGTGGSGGASAGTGGKAGSSAQGGTTTGGHGGTTAGTGGSGTAGKGGSGTTAGTGGATGGTTAEGGIGGADTSSAGAPGEGGAAGAPPVEPVQASEFWLNQYCLARSSETIACTNSTSWNQCFDGYQPYLSTVAAAVCPNETDMNNFPLTIGLANALDNLATLCPSPSQAQMHCNLANDPEFISTACRDADDARRAASVACGL